MIEFISDPAVVVAIVTALGWVVSEWISLNPKWKFNGVLQAIMAVLRKKTGAK